MKKLFVALLALSTLFVGYACDEVVDDQLGTILEVVLEDDALAVLADALDTAGLATVLDDETEYTVFAPTDTAFAALLTDLGATTEQLLAREDIDNILLYHVVEGTYDLETLADSAPTTLDSVFGMPLDITVTDDVVHVNGVALDASSEADNGVIHTVGSVLVPDGIDAVLEDAGIFETLLAAADQAGLLGALSGSDLLTVFAPNDDAFMIYLEDNELVIGDLLAHEALEAIILYHVTAGVVDAETLQANAPYSVTSLEGSPLDITVDGTVVQVNGSSVVGSDDLARNGLVHTIDTVLLPPSLIIDDRDIVDINKGLLDFNGMASNVSVTGGDTIVTAYQKSQFNSLLYFNITPETVGEKFLSDYAYINLVIESSDTTEFLVEIAGQAPMMHHVMLEEGRLELTMDVTSLMLPDWVDAIQYINLTPMPNSDTASGSFEVLVAEFSNEPLVVYTPASTIPIDAWHELGTTFAIDQGTSTISWDAGSGFKALYTRMYGSYGTFDGITKRYLAFDATVTEAVTIEFEVIGARYLVELTPDVTTYEIDFAAPTSGNADTWKFTTGFNLYLRIDTSAAGEIIFENVTVSEEQTIIPEEADVIDFNVDLSSFNGMTATVTPTEEGLDVESFSKSQFNSLLYYNITPAVKDGKLASDYPYINLVIESADVTEFLIEISGQGAMTHYVRVQDGRIEVMLVMTHLLLPQMIDGIQYINLTPMPNSADAVGSFTVLTAEFAKEPLVLYETQTSFAASDLNELGSVFTVDPVTETISWDASSGFKNMMIRMNGSYADDSALIYPYLVFDAIVASELMIELDIVGTRYGVTLTPEQTSYVVDLTTPTSGNPDLWKFATGFNLIVKIDTTLAGAVMFDNIQFKETLDVQADVIDINSALLGFNGMTANGSETEDGFATTFTKTQFNSLAYFNVTAGMKDGKTASEYPYLNLVIESADVTEFLIEIAGQAAMTHYVTLEGGRIEVTLVMTDLLLPQMIDAIQYINLTPMPNSGDATGSFTVVTAEFSKDPLVMYDAQTVVTLEDLKEVGATFDIDTVAGTITWDAASGFRNLMVRMNGAYADQDGLVFQTVTFDAVVTADVMIEIDIVGTKYQVLLTPSETSYVIDLSTPTFGNADLWKFNTGFNMLFRIDTTEAGSITLSDIIFQP